MKSTSQRPLKWSCLYCGVFGTLSILLVGCGRRAPTFNILGSFFPGWIACIASGIVLTVALRFLLLKKGWEAKLVALPLLYMTLALLFSCLFWLLIFE